MIRNYFIVAIRQLTRHKLFSIINILCLAIGITFSMLIGDYILNERSVNSGIRNVENQYLIKSNWKVKDMGLPVTTVGPLPRALKEEYPSLVANYYRVNPVTNVVSAGDRHFKENIAICDTTLVSMFGFPLLHGDRNRAFINNNSAVVTEEMAKKLYGTTDIVGKTVSVTGTVSGQQHYIVSAVLKSLPVYTTVNNFIDVAGYNMFVPFEGNHYYQGGDQSEAWSNIYNVGMIELKPGVSPVDLAAPMQHLLSTRLPGNLKGLLQPELAGFKTYYLDDNDGAVRKMITTLSLVAIFILLMAIINFVNISMGTSSYRLKEIGLRKVFGSGRKQLILQYLTESLLLSFVAGMFSVILYETVRPLFNQLLHARLDPVWAFGWQKLSWILLLVVTVGFLAGIYPAFVLSASGIVHSVKGKIDSAKGGLVLRKSLLVIQFSLAIVVFISALNISKQVKYVFDKDLGYTRDQLLVLTVFPKQWDSAGVLRMNGIREGLAAIPAVQSTSLSFEVPDRKPPNTIDILPRGAEKPIVVSVIEADEDFGSTYDLQLKEGNFFKKFDTRDRTSEIVLNETAAKSLGVHAGEQIHSPAGFNFNVTGIIKDFNYSSFQQGISPLAFVHVRNTNRYRYLTLKLHTTDISRTLAHVRAKWNSLSPGSPFEFSFMDDKFATLYRSELQLKDATGVATALNLLIVFMGIFGIVAFTLARRTREIAVRKVLGAETRNIIYLFVKEYTLLILIANIIAWPLAWMATDYWLHSYVYRVEQNLMSYLFVGVLMFAMAFLFIAAQCFRTATSNPVKSLRTD
jgi:putative ABC transport system permease protein